MDFAEQLQALATKIGKQRQQVNNEQATKTAFVMPFIAALGYDVFDPNEVEPEFVADVGTKKGEKVDYVIKVDGQPIMIFECKKIGSGLDINSASQLYRYFAVSKTKFGVLTDGAVYKFFTDLDETNKMDLKPFLEVDISNPNHPLLPELKRFTKSTFSVEDTLEAARVLKYVGGIKSALAKQLNTPSDEFVRILASEVYGGQMRQAAREEFTEIVKRAFSEFLRDQVNDRLRSALNDGDRRNSPAESGSEHHEAADGESRREIATLAEEIEGYHIVKSILRETASVKRIAMRDTRSYCGVLLDDNNRKPVCRLYLHRSQWYIGLFDERKAETRHAISELEDVYKFSDHLRQTVTLYDTNQMKDTEAPAAEEPA